MAQPDLFDIHEGAAQPAAPFVLIEMPGKPRGKGRHRSRLVVPKEAWVWIGGQQVITRQTVDKLWIHQYADPKTAAFEEELALRARAAMRGKAMIAAGTAVAIRVFAMVPVPPSWPKARQHAALDGRIKPLSRPDDDNYRKILDALNGVVWHDDCQVWCALTVKEYAAKPGLWIEVYVSP